jgi:hypothetical protein
MDDYICTTRSTDTKYMDDYIFTTRSTDTKYMDDYIFTTRSATTDWMDGNKSASHALSPCCDVFCYYYNKWATID